MRMCKRWSLLMMTGYGLTPSLTNRATASVDLEYVLNLSSTEPPAVEVSLACLGSPAGTTTFAVSPEWGGVRDAGKGIFDVSVRSAQGAELAVEHPADHQWAVRHEPSQALRLTCTLRERANRPVHGDGNDYRIQLRDKLFFMIGNIGLPAPEHFEGETPRSIRLEWRGFHDAGWKTVSSFANGSTPIQVNMPVDRFRHSLFVAGEFRLHEVPIDAGQPAGESSTPNKLGIVLVGPRFRFSDGQFVRLASKIVAAEREFFRPVNDPWYLISVMPTGGDDPNTLSIGGTGLTHAFALWVSRGATLERGSPSERPMKRLLAHEYFHRWNGGELEFAQPEQQLYWFSEGFTDFYARRILLRAELYSPEEFATDLNESLRNYFNSPVRQAPNERIVRDFWSHAAVRDLPYRRGDLLALAIDDRIRGMSGGTRSLDDLMRGIIRTGRSAGEWTLEALLQRILMATDADFAAVVERCILLGEDVPLPSRIVEPRLRIRRDHGRIFDLGFDESASQSSGMISGVVEGSRAHDAGLRNGQKLRGWSYNRDEIDRPVELTVEQDGKEQKLRYVPAGAEVSIPKYEPDDS